MTATMPAKRGKPRKENMTPTTDVEKQANATPQATKLKAKKKVFDLEKFEKVSKEVEYEKPAPLKSMDEVIALDESFVLNLINLGRVRQAWKDARNSIAGVSPKIINQFVNVWRLLPPYSTMVVNDADGKPTKESRSVQTKAIYAFIKSQESILDSLKQAAAASSDEDEDEEETEESE